MSCNIYQEVKNVGLSAKKVEKAVEQVLRFLKKNKLEVSIHLVGDKKIKTINKNYRGKDKVTDVIAFALQEGVNIGNNVDLGDIFISVPQIKRQAKENMVGYKEEFVRMLVHGILHLSGFDHIEKKDADKMFSLQEKMVQKISKSVL